MSTGAENPEGTVDQLASEVRNLGLSSDPRIKLPLKTDTELKTFLELYATLTGLDDYISLTIDLPSSTSNSKDYTFLVLQKLLTKELAKKTLNPMKKQGDKKSFASSCFSEITIKSVQKKIGAEITTKEVVKSFKDWLNQPTSVARSTS